MIFKIPRQRLVTWTLGLYFIMAGTDCIAIPHIGSLLRLFVFLPVLTSVMNLRQWKIRMSPITVTPLIYWIFSLTTAIWSIQFDYSKKSLITLSLNLALIFTMGMLETFNRDEIIFLLRCMLLGCLVSMCMMLVFQDNLNSGRVTISVAGSAQDANYINGFLLFAFAYCMIQFFDRGRNLKIVFAGAIFVLGLSTGSRGALLAYVSVFCVSWMLSRHSDKHFVKSLLQFAFFAIMVLILLNVINQLVPGEVFERFTLSYLRKKGTTGRVKIWKYLLELFWNASPFHQIFGHGYGTTVYLNRASKHVAHNLYIDNLISIGLIGLLIQISMQILFLKALYRMKQYTLLATYCGYITMCLSLSLTSYKPIWNLMLMTMMIYFGYYRWNQMTELEDLINRSSYGRKSDEKDICIPVAINDKMQGT